MQIQNIIKKVLGGFLTILSFFILASVITLILQGDFGPAGIGVLFFFFDIAIAQRLQAPMSELRSTIEALMTLHFPKCPICKSSKGYNVSGFWSWSQYVVCKNCKSQFSSLDLVGYKDLKTLKLSALPADPKITANFLTTSPLKLQKIYSIDLWKSFMLSQEIQLPINEGKINIKKIIISHKIGSALFLISFFVIMMGINIFSLNHLLSCLSMSIGFSLFMSLFGFYFMSVNKNDSYRLFIASLLGLFFGLYKLLPKLII